MKRKLQALSKATIALIVMGGVLVVEIIGYVVMASLGVAVPSEYVSLMITTLTVLAGVAGAQYANGKIAHS